MFYQSAVSDWNHGNAHFLRGVAAGLIARGHDVRIYEPFDSWCMENLLKEYGTKAIRKFEARFPCLKITRYDFKKLDMEECVDGADLVIVHEWNRHELVNRIGRIKAATRSFRLFFHDTHHRSLTESASIERFDLSNYDGVLAFGLAIKDIYARHGWTDRVYVWHEAADTNVFRPVKQDNFAGDVVWIGNWGDEERTSEIYDFFVGPVRELKLKSRAYGVRYPASAIMDLKNSGIEYAGWLPNYEVPETFSRFKATVHIPRRPYSKFLPGIPTIRPFEALACGIPLVSAPWEDSENLFTPGEDFLIAHNKKEMKKYLKDVLNDEGLAHALSEHGLKTILSRHTCAHRVEELFHILGTEDAKPNAQKQTEAA